eukprot:CAMPEP_0201571850 /NCGR_PEP_ID=MMETSP0190_2-20130828/14819_1 /ASSEMBLY_ACC=CAM_ASM_000263 /TAXON_ID=37353 /ORGANISM="Rosalina sp." /LENGTH=145 /DNA_ID=CAMNT_0047996955 /DNA_START=26 /DNA_END=463 /DNA_ORIENTATION=-
MEKIIFKIEEIEEIEGIGIIIIEKGMEEVLAEIEIMRMGGIEIEDLMIIEILDHIIMDRQEDRDVINVNYHILHVQDQPHAHIQEVNHVQDHHHIQMILMAEGEDIEDIEDEIIIDDTDIEEMEGIIICDHHDITNQIGIGIIMT